MNKQVNLVRYCDDFLITGLSKEVLEQEVKPLVTDFLWERGLELSEEKTTITHIEDGFDFLGQHVRKYNGHFLTRPAKKNVKAFLTDIRKVIEIPHLFRMATRQHLGHQVVIVGPLVAWMGLLKRRPAISKNLLEDVPVPRGRCKHTDAPS